LETALAKGLLPEIYLSDSGFEILENYTNIYLKEEILAEALVRNYASFGHFLELAAHMSWKELNYSQLASDSEIPKETIRRYVEILEDTLLIHRIPGFTNVSSNRKAIQKEKILFFDIGVRNAIIGTHKNKHSPAEWGHLFEHLIVLELIALNSYRKKQWKLSYYRDSKQLEVDLLIEADDCLYAIEIKSGSVYKKEWKKNLDTFQEVYLEEKRSKKEKIKKLLFILVSTNS
jgi:predicted AAA+ superfamily ATPase